MTTMLEIVLLKVTVCKTGLVLFVMNLLLPRREFANHLKGRRSSKRSHKQYSLGTFPSHLYGQMKILVDFKKVKTKKTTGLHSFFTYLKLVKMSIPVKHLKQYSDNGVPFSSNNKARGSLSSLRNTSHS